MYTIFSSYNWYNGYESLIGLNNNNLHRKGK